MRGEGIFADLLAHRFKLSCHKLGMSGERTGFCTDLFKVPDAWQQSQNSSQLALF
jgi:hypothetical protein